MASEKIRSQQIIRLIFFCDADFTGIDRFVAQTGK
jgi:hypothetical protein